MQVLEICNKNRKYTAVQGAPVERELAFQADDLSSALMTVNPAALFSFPLPLHFELYLAGGTWIFLWKWLWPRNDEWGQMEMSKSEKSLLWPPLCEEEIQRHISHSIEVRCFQCVNAHSVNIKESAGDFYMLWWANSPNVRYF